MEEQNNVNVEEKKEEKVTYKKHGPLYWLIIIVGMGFIVFMSVRMGMKIAEEKIDKENGGKPSVTSNSNSNEETPATSNSNSNVETKELSNDEALNIGRDLYKKAIATYPHPLSGALDSKCTAIKTPSTQGLDQYDCTSLYNELKTIYPENNEVFKSFKLVDGKYIFESGGIGFVGKITTTLSVKSIEANKVVFNAAVELYNEPDKSTTNDNYEFVIAKENDTWKISSYKYVLGDNSSSSVVK